MAKIDINGDGDGDVSKGLVMLAIGLIFAPKKTLRKVDRMANEAFIMFVSIFMKSLYIVITVIIPLIIGSNLSHSDSYWVRFLGNLLFAGSLIFGCMNFRVFLNERFSFAELMLRSFTSMFFVIFPILILSREDNGWFMTLLLYLSTCVSFFMFVVALLTPVEDTDD